MSSKPQPSTAALDSVKSNIQKAYDAISQKYSEWTVTQHPTREKYLNILLSHLTSLPTISTSKQNPEGEGDKEHGEERTALEVGCGTGTPTLSALASSGLFEKVIGNDISSTNIQTASRVLSSFDSVSFREGDMMALSFEPQSLTAVVGMYSLIHLPREEQVTFLERVYTWLKPGGYLLANFGAVESEGNYSKGWLGGEEGEMFWSSWGEEGTCCHLERIGFELVVREVWVDLEDGADGNEDESTEVRFLWVLARKKRTEIGS
ncbi:S-adenosyl-L-methionine-dependent methyltransferase [Aspergillus karnatakaensis]|uniref:class I SAM-dependent methyltransferase n=1 Tax=Aspergillus karnatakaensis TaxID=1810916 RepID=UPI003CCD8B46